VEVLLLFRSLVLLLVLLAVVLVGVGVRAISEIDLVV